MIKSHGHGSRGLHIVGNFYPLEDGHKATGFPELRKADITRRLPRHISSQPTLYVVGKQSGPDSRLVIETKGAVLNFDAPTFAKQTVAFATGTTALRDAEAALANAKTPGHRNRAQARVDRLNEAAEYASLPNSIYYIGKDGHLYSSTVPLAPGRKTLAADEIAFIKQTLLQHLEPVVVKNVDVTSQALDAILDKGLTDVDAFVSELYPVDDAAQAAREADKILDSAALFQYIRGVGEESATIGEYLDGYLCDAALVRERALAFGTDKIIVSNYERSMNMGESCARLSGVVLTPVEALQLHFLVEDALIGKYTVSQTTHAAYYDVGDYLQLFEGYSITAAASNVTLTYGKYSSVGAFPVSYDGCDFGKLRDAFRRAMVNAYKFMFDRTNPLLFTWANIGSIYLEPAIKG